MDDAATDLIVQLCTRAGVIMEDHVDAALTIRSMPREEWLSVIAALENAGDQIITLTRAAKAIAL